jgi:glycosyltransferase involved in cell wall biosynthesis
MSFDISVVICTHNPRVDYLTRVLNALKAQSLPKHQWELILIDNASKEALADNWDLSWHPSSRHCREPELGLTPTRLRGIKEAQAEVILFVDDDNVLDANYLESSLEIAQKRAYLGAWGGQIRPEFEIAPPEWTRGFWNLLCIREVDNDRWSNQSHVECIPWGAGLSVRRTVAQFHSDVLARHPVRRQLDRRGTSLASGGDVDLALSACDAGFGMGVFRSLSLVHLIPACRLEPAYLLRLAYGIDYSSHLLNFVRSGVRPPRASFLGLANLYASMMFKNKYERGRFRAVRKALRDARQAIASLGAFDQVGPHGTVSTVARFLSSRFS